MSIELRYAVVGMVLIVACRQPIQDLRRVVREARRGPQIQATVVTLRTTLQPANKATTTTLIIADDLARSTEEVGEWRLFDLKENRVAFVNDFAKTYRYESVESMRERHADASSEAVSEKIPLVEYSSTSAHRDILGVPATESVVKLGGYRREIWFGSHPLIPPQLFALMQASGTPGPDAPVSKRLDDALLSMRGFPLADHAELPYAQTKIVVDRDVVSIDRKNVTASLLDIPDTYREVKPQPRPAPRPRPAAPPPAAVPAATTATTATVAPAPPPPLPTTTTVTTTAPTTTPPTSTSVVPAETGTYTETQTFGPPKPPVTHKKKPVVTKKSTATKKGPAIKKAPATPKAPARKASPAKSKKTTTKKKSGQVP